MKQNYHPKTWHWKIFMFNIIHRLIHGGVPASQSCWGLRGGLLSVKGPLFFSLKGPETTVTWRVKGRFVSFMAGRPEKYCWWFRNPARKPVLHGNYISILYMVSFMSGGAGFLPTVFLFYWDPCKCKFDTRSILSPFYQDYGYSRNLLASILLKSIPFCSCLTCSVTHWWIWML